jgi:hypothetical protein
MFRGEKVKGERRAVKITNKTAKLAQKCMEKATQMRRSKESEWKSSKEKDQPESHSGWLSQ